MSTSPSRIGVVGDDQTARRLAEAGFRVVTAETFGAAATAVTGAVRTDGLDAVLVIDSDAAPAGTHLWARTTAAKVATAIVRTGPASLNLPVQDRALEARIPVNVAEVLIQLGVDISLAARADFVLGAAAEEPLPLALPAAPEPPAPVVSAATPAHAAPRRDEPPAAAYEPVSQPAAPRVEELHDPWTSSSTLGQPVTEWQPEPVAQPAPVEQWQPEPQWEPAPQPTVERWSAQSPAQADEAVRQPAPVAQPAPVEQWQPEPQWEPAPQPAVEQARDEDMWSTSSALSSSTADSSADVLATHSPVPGVRDDYASGAAPEPATAPVAVTRGDASYPGNRASQAPFSPSDVGQVAPPAPWQDPAAAPVHGDWDQPPAPQPPAHPYRQPGTAGPDRETYRPVEHRIDEHRPVEHRGAPSPWEHQPTRPAPVQAVAPQQRPGARRGKLIVPLAAKGGVGKSSSALALAQRAATRGPDGYRVTLIDANRGQGDLRVYLRTGQGRLPTIYDAALSGNPADALVFPEQINAARGDGWGEVAFALVCAPPAEAADPAVVSSEVYRQMIEYARSVSDLVVVDTQIAETFDTSGLFNQVLLPMLARDGWAFALSDLSTAGVMNLLERLRQFSLVGLSRDRVMVTLNRMSGADAKSVDSLSSYMDAAGTYLGAVPQDTKLAADMNVGKPIGDNAVMAPIIDAALYRVTGLPEFATGSPGTGKAGKERRGFFSRRKAS